ncbi:MAG: hypothetical protein K2I10_10400 [Lachnospiraceae bacterium]|nr:hypothetical protein [Lachnospiraceae bacterium]
MEVVKVAALDFTFERRENLIRRDSLGEGIKRGEQKKLMSLICRKLRKGKTPEEIGEDLDVILPICEAARSFALEYDEEQTAEKFLEKMHRFF